MKFNGKLLGKVSFAAAKVLVPQIGTAEEAFRQITSGPDKKKAVLDAVRTSVELSEALSGHEIADEALLIQGLGKINDGYVDVMRAVRADET